MIHLLRHIPSYFDNHLIAEKDLEKRVMFYQKTKGAIGFFYIVFFVLIVIGSANVFLSTKDKDLKFFLHTPDFSRVEQVELSKESGFSNEKIKSYLNKVLFRIYDVNFNNIEERKSEIASYFAPESWGLFEISWDSSVIPNIKDNRLISKITLIQEPTYLWSRQGFNDRRVHYFETRAIITHLGSIEGGKVSKVTNFLIGVEESDLVLNPLGVSIREFKTQD